MTGKKSFQKAAENRTARTRAVNRGDGRPEDRELGGREGSAVARQRVDPSRGGFMNRRKIAVAALFALLTAAGNWNSAAAQSLLNISYSALSATQAPMWVAHEMKLYAKYGIETRMLYIAGSPTNVAALLSGEIQVTQIAPAAALPAIERGGNLSFIAVTTPKVFHYLISRPEIKDVRDLKGKRVGVSRFGSLSDLSATLVLKEHGLESKRDVTILQAGGMSEATAALTRGALDAAILSTPWHVKAVRLGLKQLASLPDLGVDYPSTCLVSSKEAVKARRDEIKRFMKAYVEAMHVIRKNRTETLKVFEKYTKTVDPFLLDAAYRETAYMQEIPWPTEKLILAALRAHKMEDKLFPDSIRDDSLLQELQQEGFLATFR